MWLYKLHIYDRKIKIVNVNNVDKIVEELTKRTIYQIQNIHQIIYT